MADPVTGAIVQVALQTALSLASSGIGSLLGFKKDVDNIRQSLTFINAVLAGAEERQQNQGLATEERQQDQDLTTKETQEWLKSLEEFAYNACNVLDKLHYESLRHKVESRNPHKLKVRCFFSFSKFNPILRWRMVCKFRDIKLNLDNIYNQARVFGGPLVRGGLPAAVGDTRSRQPTDSVPPELIFGRDNDKSNILEMLLDESNHKFVSVIPITGEEGLGKTNLVKSIYNHQRMGKFGVKLWVCVSKRVSIEELFKLILLQLTVEKVDRENRNGIVGKIGKQRRGKRFGEDDRNAIVQQIGSQLQGERYFLVLDDVWDDNPKLWDDLFITLERINQTIGSWCLVTTRSDSVARSVSVALRREHEVYALRKLHDEDCWYILLKKAFGEKEAPDELEKIKERILQRCDGLPATACLIGLQLRNLDLNKKEESGSILDKLLSLDNLSSPSIKKCFAYCSMFPKDTKIERDMLIELWMAEGFLPTCPNNQTMMEETGMNHLRILWESWLLEEIRHDFWEVYYKMQDVAHKHAKSMSKSTKVISDRETGNVHNGDLVRYLAVDSLGEDREELFKSLKTSLLHTLFVRSSSSSGDVLMKLKNL